MTLGVEVGWTGVGVTSRFIAFLLAPFFTLFCDHPTWLFRGNWMILPRAKLVGLSQMAQWAKLNGRGPLVQGQARARVWLVTAVILKRCVRARQLVGRRNLLGH